MNSNEPPVALRNALRQLAQEATQRAASVAAGTAEHSFYVGVSTAAQDRLNPVHRDVRDEAWLERETLAFRDGYLKASNLIAVRRRARPAPPRHARAADFVGDAGHAGIEPFDPGRSVGLSGPSISKQQLKTLANLVLRFHYHIERSKKGSRDMFTPIDDLPAEEKVNVLASLDAIEEWEATWDVGLADISDSFPTKPRWGTRAVHGRWPLAFPLGHRGAPSTMAPRKQCLPRLLLSHGQIRTSGRREPSGSERAPTGEQSAQSLAQSDRGRRLTSAAAE